MATTIKINNFDSLNLREPSKLKSDAVAGDTTLSMVNNNNFTVGSFVLIGKPGGETSEVVAVLTQTGANTITCAALKFKHRRDSEVNLLFGDQVNIYRASNVNGTPPADNSFTTLAIVSLDIDQPSTTYTDAGGGSGYWYRFTYRNSVGLVETDITASIPARAASGQNNYAPLDEIRSEAGFKNATNITDDKIDRKRQSAQARINGMLAGKYVVPFTAPINAQIIDITVRLAAGMLMCEEYGSFDDNNKTLGEKKRDDAIAELKELQAGTSVLTDVTGADTTAPNGGGFSAWPNKTTDQVDTTQGGAPRMFRMGDIVGYSTRQY